MKRIPLVLCVTMLCLFIISPLTYLASSAELIDYHAGEVLLKLNPEVHFVNHPSIDPRSASLLTNDDTLSNVLHSLGAYEAELLDSVSNTYRVLFDTTIDAVQLATQLADNPAVIFAEPNPLRFSMYMPNDPLVVQQWALTVIQAFDAWHITTGGEIVIAVLDTGVSLTHPDLEGKVLPGYNALQDNNHVEDDNGHGTAVAGLIAASTNNQQGIAGMCWGCRILPVKVLNARGGGDDASVSRGVRWAVDNGAQIINMSLGGSRESQTLREAIEYAFQQGVLIVASSGNDRPNGNPINYPAAYPEVIAVGATGTSDAIAGFSNTGDYIMIAAPGVNLWTTTLDGAYGAPNGTSFASSYVAGTAALVFTLRPDLRHEDVTCILQASADDKGSPGKDPEYGWGRLNALRAVQLAQTYQHCPLDQPAPVEPSPMIAAEDVTSTHVPAAFYPVPFVPDTPDLRFFAETQHTIRGIFKQHWETHGEVPIFGFPISEEFVERDDSGHEYIVQYFERHRFELHPTNPAPYNVQISRLGDLVLQSRGWDWVTFPRSAPRAGCLFFADTGYTVCEPFLSYWRSNGIEFDGLPGKSFAESIALFGQPLTEPQLEEVSPGVIVKAQWFERARLEDHGSSGILLGRLSDELVRTRGWR